MTSGHHNCRVLCAAGRPLGLTTWLAVPYLFAGAVLGLTGLAGLLVGSFGWTIALSSPVFGAATAVTAAVSGGVRWTASWQRTWLRWGYPAFVLVLGILVDGVQLPVVAMVGVGVPMVAGLVGWCVVERRRSSALAAAGQYSTTGC